MSQHSHVHFRCSFRLEPIQLNTTWSDLIKDIRYWLSKNRNARFDDESLCKKWLFCGGKLKDNNRAIVETQTEIGNGTEIAPQYWSLRFEHSDREFSFRQWRTDIGITIVDNNKYDFSLVLSHSLSPDYIGEEPQIPEATTPALIQTLLGNKIWNAYAGSQQLTTSVLSLDSIDVPILWTELTNLKRKCPVILFLPDKETGEINIDADRLAKLLVGTAVVYIGTSGVHREIHKIFGENYALFQGYVRIYLTELQPQRHNDHKRHRYFAHKNVDSPSDLEDMIVRSIARRERLAYTEALTTLEDIGNKRRESRLQLLRSQGASNEEWARLLEEENLARNTEIQDLVYTKEQLEYEYAELEDKYQSLTDTLKNEQHKGEHWHNQYTETHEQNRHLKNQLNALQSLSSLPSNLSEVIEAIESFHSFHVAFTPKAKESALMATFNDITTAWRCLWSIATTLHDLYFDSKDQGIDIEREFKSRTGFDLSPTESKQTKRDKDLMTLRSDFYNGQEIEFAAHVGYGSRPPDCLRVHYYVHRGENKLIIGHCGDHLDTSGTRRRS